MENILEVKDLSKKYKDFSLNKVNIVLPKGSIMGFVGENGAGKSTTIKLILDLVYRDHGSISIFGDSNIKNNNRLKEDIGVVFDGSNFPESMHTININSVMKNIFKNWDEAIFRSYLKKFSLPPDKTIKEYSRGMLMKLSIAVALSHHAKLLILDEATSGLDPIIRDEILDVFLDFIQDEEHSIFISTHIISDLEKIADYITFIHKGKIVFSEPKDNLLHDYGILKCSISDYEKLDKSIIIGCRRNKFGVDALVKRARLNGKYTIDNPTLEDIMLFQIREEIK